MKPVVVIDDDEDIRDVIVFALENDGFEVQSFINGKLGLEALNQMDKNKLPGLIIVDYLMPEMDGLTFIKTIEKDYSETLGMIPVAFSSAMGGLDKDYLESRNVSLLKKPMDLADLLAVARKHCS